MQKFSHQQKTLLFEITDREGTRINYVNLAKFNSKVVFGSKSERAKRKTFFGYVREKVNENIKSVKAHLVCNQFYPNCYPTNVTLSYPLVIYLCVLSSVEHCQKLLNKTSDIDAASTRKRQRDWENIYIKNSNKLLSILMVN